ncbi:MAG TPA: sulfite exporter TauE/SafE family protein [Dongiaceae bacterium]|nr:sulfite exporter TauE/SafE family protein [Dongiaceae bacterium]
MSRLCASSAAKEDLSTPISEISPAATRTKPAPPEAERHFRYWSWWLVLLLGAWGVGLGTCFPEPLELFRKHWIYIPVGFCGAFLGNISAVGGGIVFIPVFMFVFHLPPVTALKIALASQSCGMTSGAIGWIQKRVVPLRALLLTVPGLLTGSALSSLVFHPSALLVKLLFGPFSILLGILTLVLARRAARNGEVDEIPASARVPLAVISFVGGLITGWIAIGEGELIAALLMLAYGVNAARCIGLGVVLLSINSIFLTLLHTLFLGGIPWDIAIFTGLGCVFGARLAPFLSRKSNPLVLKIIFATIAICDGILFIVQYLILHHGN